MYERNPFSSFFFSFILEKRMQKEMTIRGTPFHTVLDLSSNCEVACSLSLVLFFWKKEKKNKPISTACLRPFQKRSLASVHTKKRKFCVGAKRRKVSCRLFIFCWAWQRKRKKRRRKSSSCGTVSIKTVCAAPSGPPLVSSTGDAGWTESTFFGSRCWLMSDPKKDVAC